MADHQPIYVIIILINLLALITTILFHYAAEKSVRDLLNFPNNWYLSDGGVIADKYPTPITPNSWTSYIWIVVFFFQLLWVCYTVSLLCRVTADKKKYLYDQGYIPVWMYLFFLLALVFHLGAVFSYDRDSQVSFTFMELLISLCTLSSLVLCYTYLFRYGSELLVTGQEFEVTMVRALIQNGLAMYMAWSGFLFVLSLTSNLVYKNGVNPTDAGTIGLSLLALLIVVYGILDIFVVEKHMCYTFSTYVIGLAGLVGILTENYQAWERNTVITCVVITLILVVFGFKVGFTMWRWRTCPEPLRCSEGMKTALEESSARQQKSDVIVTAPQQQTTLAYPWYQPQPVYYMPPYESMAYQPAMPLQYSMPYQTYDQGQMARQPLALQAAPSTEGQVYVQEVAAAAPQQQQPVVQQVVYQAAPTQVWVA